MSVPLSKTRYVEAVEINVGVTTAVRYAALRVDSTDSSRTLDASDEPPGYAGGASPNAQYPDGYVLAWTPGQIPARSRSDMAWRLEPGMDLSLELHLRKSGAMDLIRPKVALYFAANAPKRLPVALRLQRDAYVFPVDVELQAIHPLAQSRTKSVRASARLPTGLERTLIDIPAWDVNWQELYRYREPVLLPRGTTVRAEFTYDASASLPDDAVLSEVPGELWLQVLPARASDRARLVEDAAAKR